MVLAYGVCAGPSDKLERILLPSIRATDPDAPVLVRRSQRSIAEAYASIIAEAQGLPGLEGLVLVHDDVELRSPLRPALAVALAEPDVGLVGAVGGRGFVSGRWWDTTERFGRAPDPFRDNTFMTGAHDVDAVDGLMLVLAPRAFGHVRLSRWWYPAFHGYDVDLAAQVRAAGLRVCTADVDVFHHCKEGWGNETAFMAADRAYRLRWTSAPPTMRARWAARLVAARVQARVRPVIRDSWSS